MKIDLNSVAAGGITASQAQKGSRAEKQSDSTAIAQDATTFSADLTSVSALEQKALQAPEVREEKVAALRSAVQNGSYRIDRQQVAEAILADRRK